MPPVWVAMVEGQYFSLVSPLARGTQTLAAGPAGRFSEKSGPASIKFDARADFTYFIERWVWVDKPQSTLRRCLLGRRLVDLVSERTYFGNSKSSHHPKFP